MFYLALELQYSSWRGHLPFAQYLISRKAPGASQEQPQDRQPHLKMPGCQNRLDLEKNPDYIKRCLRDRLMAGRRVLAPLVKVRILVPQPPDTKKALGKCFSAPLFCTTALPYMLKTTFPF